MTTEQNEQTLEQSVIDAISEWVGETSSDHLVAAARAATAALRAAGEPVAFVPLSKAERTKGSPVWNETRPAGAPDAWVGYDLMPLYAAQPAPSASVREIERELADCQGALDIIAAKRIPDNKTQWGNERYYQGRKRSLEFVLGLFSSTPSPLMAAGEADETAPELTSDFAKALPGGPLDDSTYSAIEDALDAIDAPMTEGSRYMTLVERIMALRAAAGEAAETVDAADAEQRLLPCPFCASHHVDYSGAPGKGYHVECLSCLAKSGWGDYGYQAQTKWNKRATAPAARASVMVEATSPAKRDYAARAMGEAEAQMGALQEMKAAEDADIDFLIDNLRCGNAADRDVIRLFRKQIIQTAAAYAVQAMAMAEPTREEIAAVIEPHAAGAIAHHGRGNASTQAVRDYDAALNMADAILALKPRGEPAREGGE